ncbi:hypothetical protein ABTJ90_19695, partial [Acinetobacter baumannii]
GGLRLSHPSPHGGGFLAKPPFPLGPAPGAPGAFEAGLDRTFGGAFPSHEGGGGEGGEDGGWPGGFVPPHLRSPATPPDQGQAGAGGKAGRPR